MAITIQPYDHTLLRNRTGSNQAGDTYIINLYSALPFNQAATTKAAAESGATQLATANGYTQDAKALSGVTIAAFATSGVNMDANDVEWVATGGSIAAGFALLYNDSDTNDPPMYRIDFDGTVTATDGVTFRIAWNANGIESYTV